MSDDRSFWEEFIEQYKSLPSLWKIKSKEYSNRVDKNRDYEMLVEKLKEIDPAANRDVVVKKINNMRSAYRRELKKIRDSEKSGAGSDDVYVPTLWYFNLLEFLRDQEQSLEGRNSMDECSEECIPKAIKRKISSGDKLIQLACEKLQMTTEPSKSDSLAQSWAHQYNEMEFNQKMLARKIISDILFHGCMGTLQIEHTTQIQSVLNSPIYRSPIQLPTPTESNHQYLGSMQNSLSTFGHYPTATSAQFIQTPQSNTILSGKKIIRIPTPSSSCFPKASGIMIRIPTPQSSTVLSGKKIIRIPTPQTSGSSTGSGNMIRTATPQSTASLSPDWMESSLQSNDSCVVDAENFKYSLGHVDDQSSPDEVYPSENLQYYFSTYADEI